MKPINNNSSSSNNKKNNLLSLFANKLINGEHNLDTSSSSDESFVCNLSHDDEEDDDFSDSDDKSEESGSDESDETENDDNDDENENEYEELEKNQKHSNDNKITNGLNRTIINKDSIKTENESKIKSEEYLMANSKKLKQHEICCVCLNEQSESYDELVSCDSCGFYTHEGCYGICDTESKESSNSSASTEPWFCNSCLVENRYEPNLINQNGLNCFKRNCELCPNTECGLLKETENGKFVHNICALYTDGIAYPNTDKLWPVVLDEIPPNKWGEQICSLCDNIRYSRTGVCIKCDAGMCKTYFHVTCAQRNGLLTDPIQNSNDPFIAYCKIHNEKATINARRTNYLAMMSSYRVKNLKDKQLFEIDSDRARLELKFKKAKQNYEFEKEKMNKPSIVLKSKMLTTCPSALKLLIAKNNLLNNESLNDVIIDQQFHSTSTITFTPDFVKYYFERETKIPQCYVELENLKESQKELTKLEFEMRTDYENKLNERQQLIDKNKELTDKFKIYSNLIEKCLPKSKYPSDLIDKILNWEIKKEKQTEFDLESEGKNKSQLNKSIVKSPIDNKTPKQIIINKINLDASCTICSQKINSHLLIDCDTCKNYYHINCLDPPLSSVPKKTKLYGWECAKCVRKKDNSSEDECLKQESILNELTSKRSLRRERKHRDLKKDYENYEIKTPKKRAKKSTKSKKLEHKIENNSESESTSVKREPESDKSTKSINLFSDSEAIFIEDDETQSPKAKLSNSIILAKGSKNKLISTPSASNSATNMTSNSTNSGKLFKKKSSSSNSNCSNTKKNLNKSLYEAKDEIVKDPKRTRSLSPYISENDLDEAIESVIKSVHILGNRKQIKKVKS